jgi:hypothetical protein
MMDCAAHHKGEMDVVACGGTRTTLDTKGKITDGDHLHDSIVDSRHAHLTRPAME